MRSSDDRRLLTACDIHQVGNCQSSLNQRLYSLQNITTVASESQMTCTQPSIVYQLVGLILPHGQI